jgi:hypothetical protein
MMPRRSGNDRNISRLFLDKRNCICRSQRLTHIIALYFVAIVVAKKFKLLPGLDALRDYVEFQAMRHRDYHLGNRHIAGIADIDKGSVDFQGIDREALKISER